MATQPYEDDEPQPRVAARVSKAVTAPIERPNRAVTFLAIAAGGGSLAPDPIGAIVAMACVIAAVDTARRR